MKRAIFVSIGLACLLALAFVVVFNKRGIITGSVVDSNGHPLASASVEIVGTPTRAVTDQAGVFRLSYTPGPLTLRIQSAGHFPKMISINLPAANESTVPTTQLAAIPSTADVEKLLRQYLTALSKPTAVGNVSLGACFSPKAFADTCVVAHEDRCTVTTHLTLVSREPFTWGRTRQITSEQVALFENIVGGFKQRSYPPGYTFTRALRATVAVDDGPKGGTIEKLEVDGTPGEDVQPPCRDFGTFIVGRWGGSGTFEFHADGTWSAQQVGSAPKTTYRNWSAEGDVLTLTEPGHITRYTNLTAGSAELTLWNSDGPIKLTRIQSVVAGGVTTSAVSPVKANNNLQRSNVPKPPERRLVVPTTQKAEATATPHQ